MMWYRHMMCSCNSSSVVLLVIVGVDTARVEQHHKVIVLQTAPALSQDIICVHCVHLLGRAGNETSRSFTIQLYFLYLMNSSSSTVPFPSWSRSENIREAFSLAFTWSGYTIVDNSVQLQCVLSANNANIFTVGVSPCIMCGGQGLTSCYLTAYLWYSLHLVQCFNYFWHLS